MTNEKVTTKKLSISFSSSNELQKCVHGDTIDEIIDGLEILRDGKFINHFVFKFPNLSEKQLTRLDSIILTSNDAEEISKYAQRREILSNIEAFEDTLIKLKNAEEITNFTKNVPGVNVEKMENAIIEIGNTHWMLEFAKCVKGCNLEKIKKALFKQKDAFDIYCFFCHILLKDENVEIDMNDILEAEKIIIEAKDTQTMTFWAKRIKYADVAKMRQAVIQSKKAWEMYEFAKEVKDTNIEEIRQAIEETNDEECIKKFNSEFKLESVKKVRKGILGIFKNKHLKN